MIQNFVSILITKLPIKTKQNEFTRAITFPTFPLSMPTPFCLFSSIFSLLDASFFPPYHVVSGTNVWPWSNNNRIRSNVLWWVCIDKHLSLSYTYAWMARHKSLRESYIKEVLKWAWFVPSQTTCTHSILSWHSNQLTQPFLSPCNLRIMFSF